MADDGVIASNLEWHSAPLRTRWGSMMMQATIELDKANTLDLYCDKDALHLVDAALRRLVGQPEPAILLDAVDNGDRALWCVLAAAAIRVVPNANTAHIATFADDLLSRAPKQ